MKNTADFTWSEEVEKNIREGNSFFMSRKSGGNHAHIPPLMFDHFRGIFTCA